MKPFNLEEALAGKPVVTKSGKKVDLILRLPSPVYYPLLVHIEGCDWVYQTTLDGIPYLMNFPNPEITNSDSLFMASEKKTVYVNFYKYGNSNYYHTKEEAENAANKWVDSNSITMAIAVPVGIEV